MELRQYDDAVHTIYDAAIDPQRWPACLARMCALFGGQAGLLFTPVHSPAQGGFAFTHNISQGIVERWGAKSITDDVYVRKGTQLGLLTDGVSVNGDDIVPREELLTSPFYRDIWEPAGLFRASIGIVFGGSDSRKLPTAMCIYRGPESLPFDATHAELMRRLVLHMSRALGVMFHLRDQRLQVAASLAALDQLPSVVALLDAQGHCTFLNQAARAQLDTGELIVTAPRPGGGTGLRLVARMQRHEAAFQALLRHAILPLSEDGAHFSEALVLEHLDGRPAGVVHAAPLGDAHGFSSASGQPRAIMFLYDLDRAAGVAPQVLCELFGMTPAEAHAALQVLQGGSAEQMAQRLGVSLNTFKTQLRMAYEKSHTHRQADLLKLLLALASH
ncbi:MAG TPA: hypothetical protein PLA97_15935 [Rubrivivax sp.]|nr:hypothetical protein [Rubrivivax sp.]